jgi:hypothetical protein
MPPKKKNIRRPDKRKKKLSLDASNVVIVRHVKIPADETLFPEKLKRINEMLKNAELMD